MQIIPFHPENFKKIQAHMQKGLPVILPTDTCYGFSGYITSEYAISLTERIKGRENKPFLILVENLSTMQKFGNTHLLSESFLQESSVPTTFLLQKTKKVPSTYFPAFQEIGIRIPDSFPPLIGFLHFLAEPIFSTSANFTGRAPLYTEESVIMHFSQFPEILFATIGDLPEIAPSSIIRVLSDLEIEKIR